MNRRKLIQGALAVPALAAVSPTAGGKGAFPQSPGLTRSVAQFIVEAKLKDLSSELLALGKKSMLDGFGLALAGSVSALSPLLERYLSSAGLSSGRASVIGTPLKVSPRFAAFANGIFIHADDYDDTQLSVAKDRIYGLLTHPTVPVLPPAFAQCEAQGASGKDLLLAYQVGVEVECKIAEAISPRHYGDGFHTTGTIGAFGSAAACAKLRGLDAVQTSRALGIAACEGGGFRNNFGSMTKPFHAGRAAEAGPVAADLAALGWTASEAILESPLAFFQAAGGGYDPAAIAGRLGKPWTLLQPGVSIKPHPSGSLTHPAMGEMQRLIRENDLRPEQVEKVEVGGNHGMTSSLFHHQPKTGLEAKFSMEFCLAILLLDRKAGLAEFTDATVQRRDVQELIRRIEFTVSPEAEAAGLDKMTSILRVRLKDGRVLSGRAQFAKGSPSNPMTYDEVADKFRGCATFARWPAAKAEAVIAAVRTLEDLPDVSGLSAALAA